MPQNCQKLLTLVSLDLCRPSPLLTFVGIDLYLTLWPWLLLTYSPGPVNNPVGTERAGVFDYWLWLRTPWGKILTQVEVCHPGRKIQYGRHKIRSIGNLGRGTWKSQHVSRSFKVGSFERYWGIFSYKIIKKIKKSEICHQGGYYAPPLCENGKMGIKHQVWHLQT